MSRPRPGLWVVFIDEEVELAPGDSIAFGRTADLVIDADNPFLHRTAGRITSVLGGWTLENLGSKVPISAIGNSGSRIQLVPGASSTVHESGRVVFQAARSRYEVVVEFGRTQQAKKVLGATSGDSTVDWGTVPLNIEQRTMLAAMAEARLLEGRSTVPSNKDVARRLGWTVKKIERKIDYLCRRLSEKGVHGLVGTLGSDASDRRIRLIEHLVATGSITVEDLALVEGGQSS